MGQLGVGVECGAGDTRGSAHDAAAFAGTLGLHFEANCGGAVQPGVATGAIVDFGDIDGHQAMRQLQACEQGLESFFGLGEMAAQ